MNIFKDIKTAISITAALRKARAAGEEPVVQLGTYLRVETSTGFLNTVEDCCLWNGPRDVYLAAERAFDALPNATKHRLAFSPKDGEFCERVRTWRELVAPAMSPEHCRAATITVLQWYRHVKNMKAR